MGPHAVRIVQCTTYFSADDEWHSSRLFTVYLDDVYIYSRTLEKHLERMRIMLHRFKEEGLKLRLKTMLLRPSRDGISGLYYVCW
jgi:hypothetical protein